MLHRIVALLGLLLLPGVAAAQCVGSAGVPFNCAAGGLPLVGDVVLGGSVSTGHTVKFTWGQFLGSPGMTALFGAPPAIGSGTPGAGAFTTLSATGNVAFTGGTINGTAIGGVTPAAGAFTTLSANGNGIALSLTGTGAMLFPSGTTGQRPDTGNAGEARYNSTTGRYEFGVGGSWVNHVRLSGDTMTGALNLGGNTLTMTGGTATAFGTAIGDIPLLVNVQGSGQPGLIMPAGQRFVFAVGGAQATDFGTVQILRQTSFTGGTGANIAHALSVETTMGANDGTHEQNLLATCKTSSTITGGFCIGGFFQGSRTAGTLPVWGIIADAIDANDAASSTSGGGVVNEFDVEANKADDAANASVWGGAGNRVGLNIVGYRHLTADTAQTQLAYGVWLTTATIGNQVPPDADTNWMSGYGIGKNVQAYNVFDSRGAVAPTGSSNPVLGLVMAAGQALEFNGGAALNSGPANALIYDTGTTSLLYQVGGSTKFAITATGVACSGLSNGAAGCSTATGTSGSVLGLLNGNNTYSGNDTFSGSNTFSGANQVTGSIYGSVRVASGTTDTLAATDCGNAIEYTNAGAVTATVPNSLPVGCSVGLAQYGAGKVSTAAGSGATQRSPHAYTGTAIQYTEIYIHVITNAGGAAAVYSLLGDGA